MKRTAGLAFLVMLFCIFSVTVSALTAEQEECFVYSRKNGEVTIAGLRDAYADAEKVCIPETINGIPVTGIGQSAVSGCKSLTDITIPGSVTSIGGEAFSGCSGLTDIRFEGSAPTMGAGAFRWVAATAVYPGNDPSWTEDVRDGISSKLIWVAAKSGGSGN